MKKMGFFVLILIFVLSFGYIIKVNDEKSINNKLLRFHVIANSDSIEDQTVKLKVRDAVLKNIGPEISKCKDLQESVEVVENNKERIEKICNEILSREGKDYTAKAMIGKYNFPVKTYGTITLPSGEYTAFRIVLGSGEGKNWWCVMFPPLCFIDITKGVTSKETDEELRKVLDDEEIKSITAFKQIDEKVEVVSHNSKTYNKTNIKENNKVELKFKSIEIFNKLKNIVKNNL